MGTKQPSPEPDKTDSFLSDPEGSPSPFSDKTSPFPSDSGESPTIQPPLATHSAYISPHSSSKSDKTGPVPVRFRGRPTQTRAHSRARFHPPSPKSDKFGPFPSENGDETTFPRIRQIWPIFVRFRGKPTVQPPLAVHSARISPHIPGIRQNRENPPENGMRDRHAFPKLDKQRTPFPTPMLPARQNPSARPLNGLCMADPGACVLPDGLYMAPKPGYAKYQRCSSAPHTCDITSRVPYISHLAFRSHPNPPHISETAAHSTPNPAFGSSRPPQRPHRPHHAPRLSPP